MEQPQTNVQDDDAPPLGPKEHVTALRKKFVPGIKITLLISMFFCLTSLIIGAINVNKCPIKPEITLFLVAKGGIGLASALITYLRDRFSRVQVTTKYLESALHSADCIFLILGIYWVCAVYKPSFDPLDDPNYCNKTAYMFAFVYVIIVITVYLAILLGFCCFLFCVCFVAGTADKNSADPESAQAINPEDSSNVPSTDDQQQPHKNV